MNNHVLLGFVLCALVLCGCSSNNITEENTEDNKSAAEISASDNYTRVDEEADAEMSPFIIWEYEGYIDECEGYFWREEFMECDYDSDGKTDRVNRLWNQQEQTAIYTVEFGNGDVLTIPKGWETGFPHVQGGDLDGDSINEILFTLSYDTSTDPCSFGDMWLFDKDSSQKYQEVKLPLASGENGAKGFTVEYDVPDDNNIRYFIKEAGMSRSEEVENDYISNWWTSEALTEFRPVYWAEINTKNSPCLRCYVEPLHRGGQSLGFNLTYRNGQYEIGYIEIEYPGD